MVCGSELLSRKVPERIARASRLIEVISADYLLAFREYDSNVVLDRTGPDSRHGGRDPAQEKPYCQKAV